MAVPFFGCGDPVLSDGDWNRHFHFNDSTAAGTSPVHSVSPFQVVFGLIEITLTGCGNTHLRGRFEILSKGVDHDGEGSGVRA
jgi:hypothetical protein